MSDDINKRIGSWDGSGASGMEPSDDPDDFSGWVFWRSKASAHLEVVTHDEPPPPEALGRRRPWIIISQWRDGDNSEVRHWHSYDTAQKVIHQWTWIEPFSVTQFDVPLREQ